MNILSDILLKSIEIDVSDLQTTPSIESIGFDFSELLVQFQQQQPNMLPQTTPLFTNLSQTNNPTITLNPNVSTEEVIQYLTSIQYKISSMDAKPLAGNPVEITQRKAADLKTAILSPTPISTPTSIPPVIEQSQSEKLPVEQQSPMEPTVTQDKKRPMSTIELNKPEVIIEQEKLISDPRKVSVEKNISTMPIINEKNDVKLIKETRDIVESKSSIEFTSPLLQKSEASTTTKPVRTEPIRFDSHDWTNKLTNTVVKQIVNRQQQITIRLDPPELGEIDVHLRVNNDKTTVQFVSASQQVRDLLDSNMNRLREQFATEEFDVPEFDVSDQGKFEKQDENNNESNRLPNIISSERDESESQDTVSDNKDDGSINYFV